MLLPLVWWFLSALVIHDESLVGDRQFWVTRPYSWRSLLAAKALFLLAFVLAPLLVSDAIVLAADGFSPRTLLPHLLWFEFLKLVILIPAALLASITDGVRQFLLGCLLVVFVIAVIMQFPSPRETPWAVPGLALFLAVPAGLLVWQYARRRTVLMRWLAAGSVICFGVSMARSSPEIAETGPPQPDVGIRFDARREPLSPRSGSGMPDRVEVNLPVELTGRERDLLNGILFDLQVQHRGRTWHPRWDWRTNLTRREDSDWLKIAFREDDYQRLQNDSVTLRAEFAIWVYERHPAVALRRGEEWQRIEGMGYARVNSDRGGVSVETRTALHEHEQKLIYTMPMLWIGTLMRGESSGIYPPSAFDLHMTPVMTFATPLAAPGMGYRSWTRRMKPGEEQPRPPDVTVQVLQPVALIKRTLTIEGVRLSDWMAKPR
jgi:hypothetical protein